MNPVARGPTRHVPVLLNEAMEFLAPIPGGSYCDATLGLGGHAQTILERSAPSGRLFGVDRDPEALTLARERLRPFADRLVLLQGRFGDLRKLLEEAGAPLLDGCLVDLGVSSLQLDKPDRGFSFRHSGPLDMRMDPTQGESAAELLARVDEKELENILRDLGEERHARRIASAIVEERRKTPFTTTFQLSALISKVAPGHKPGKDPATRSFQALRIAVNDELGEVERLLEAIFHCLKPGGRLVVLTFHSLEDRLVKHRLRDLAKTGQVRILTKHVVTPTRAECLTNPRARSAKLRASEKVAA